MQTAMPAARFFESLMGGYTNPELRIELRRRNKDPEPDGRRFCRSAWYPLSPTSLDNAYRTALVWQAKGDVFMGVLPRVGQARDDGAVPEAAVMWAEIDGADEGQTGALDLLHTAVDRGLTPPHMVIGSGGGAHAYWRLTGATSLTSDTGSVRLSTLLRRLCMAMGNQYWKGDGSTGLDRVDQASPYADPMCTNVSRILRVPGTWNWKASRNCPVLMLESNPAAPRLSLEQWDACLPPAPKPREYQRTSRPDRKPGTWLPRQTRENLDLCHPVGERYNALRSILCCARHLGWSQYGLNMLCDEFCCNNPGCKRAIIDMLMKDTMDRIIPDPPKEQP